MFRRCLFGTPDNTNNIVDDPDYSIIEQNKNCYNLLTDKYNLLDNSSKEVINFLIEKIIK